MMEMLKNETVKELLRGPKGNPGIPVNFDKITIFMLFELTLECDVLKGPPGIKGVGQKGDRGWLIANLTLNYTNNFLT
jgi:hypothetical protein